MTTLNERLRSPKYKIDDSGTRCYRDDYELEAADTIDRLTRERDEAIFAHCNFSEKERCDNPTYCSRCQPFKGQINALRTERDEARAREVKVRWVEDTPLQKLYVGTVYLACFYYSDEGWVADIMDDYGMKLLGHFPNEPSARAAVESAAIEALTEERVK